jgi:uncharacterized repeat protein (TIGR03847 family)
MSEYEFEDAEQVAVAAVGEPGQRVFLLHVRKGKLAVTLKVEKQQVAALVAYLVRLLQTVPLQASERGEEPAMPEPDVDVEPDFVVGSLAVTYDEVADRVVLVAEEVAEPSEDAEDVRTGSSARLVVTRVQAAALAKEGKRLVEGGRPPCPFCGYPLDQRGHVCPRANGAHPPLT